MSDQDKNCLYCQRDSGQVPLLELSFRGREFHICPQHIPILIHDPGRLVGLLPGAEGLSAAEPHD